MEVREVPSDEIGDLLVDVDFVFGILVERKLPAYLLTEVHRLKHQVNEYLKQERAH